MAVGSEKNPMRVGLGKRSGRSIILQIPDSNKPDARCCQPSSIGRIFARQESVGPTGIKFAGERALELVKQNGVIPRQCGAAGAFTVPTLMIADVGKCKRSLHRP